MSKKKIDKNLEELDDVKTGIKDETLHGVFAVLLFAFSLALILAPFGYAGPVGNFTYEKLNLVIGIGYYLLPVSIGLVAFALIKSLHQKFSITKIVGAVIFFISGLGIIDLWAPGESGKIGLAVVWPIEKLFGLYVTHIFLYAFLIISILVIFDVSLRTLFNFLKGLRSSKVEIIEEDLDDKKFSSKVKKTDMDDEDSVSKSEQPIQKEIPAKLNKLKINSPQIKESEDKDGISISQKNFGIKNTKMVKIPIEILEKDKGTPGVGDIKANANIIKRTLQNFGIDVEMDEISIGPSVTRYSLKPAEGVKLSRIVGLQNDLALALAAHPIRIEAPIPGKSLVGIEIPNSTKTTVGLATLLSSEEYRTSEKPLLASLGKGISGKSHFGNLAKMPHLLIAGTTGSGKSVTIHSIITSLLFRNSPSQLKFIMIDPKRVELTLYNKIPHLLIPVITEAKKSIAALKWAAKEMDRRYDILESESVRDIESYHKNVLEPEIKKIEENKKNNPEETSKTPETMPYIVIVIDELADIMTTYPRELESAIVRLAQMSRAVGIHLILSTQRPSVNVITGLIKANIPARIALQVSSQIDSRTILDTGGAEKLLGAGDMLYLSGEMSKPQRIQSSFISETELKNVVKFLIESYKDEIPSEINLAAAEKDPNAIFESTFDDSDPSEEDELYEEAKDIVLKSGRASTSYLQRKLSIGYSRAARLVDILEEKGVVGPGSGAKPREVFGSKINDGNISDNQNTEENQSALNQL